ncbi:hypothetical protein DIURU_000122 [Diutina rugosa]|uniref:Uncharacterized protein n=1 Tax=Diutina rugosa TaxID=5481 RepID=A0A642UZP2_DIURU|nr:uncharacterized protein DIURU_000122 [Diutina rugosa]KAA8908579.1 hypothetical protein DIURU_000122 [Diutina rugosa]
MLCFSIDSPDSLENVQSKWVGEITDHCDGVKLVLVALKCDLRSTDDHDDPHHPEDDSFNPYGGQQNPRRLITYDEGLAMAKKIGALKYIECSAKKNRGVNEAFSEAARCALHARPAGSNEQEPEKKGCVIV